MENVCRQQERQISLHYHDAETVRHQHHPLEANRRLVPPPRGSRLGTLFRLSTRSRLEFLLPLVLLFRPSTSTSKIKVLLIIKMAIPILLLPRPSLGKHRRRQPTRVLYPSRARRLGTAL